MQACWGGHRLPVQGERIVPGLGKLDPEGPQPGRPGILEDSNHLVQLEVGRLDRCGWLEHAGLEWGRFLRPLLERAGNVEVAGVERGARAGKAGRVERLQRVVFDQVPIRGFQDVRAVGDGGCGHPQEFINAGRERLVLVAADVTGRGRQDHAVVGRQERVEKQLPVFTHRIPVAAARRRGQQVPGGRLGSARKGGIVQAQHRQHAAGNGAHRFEPAHSHVPTDPGHRANLLLSHLVQPVGHGGSVHVDVARMVRFSGAELPDQIHGRCRVEPTVAGGQHLVQRLVQTVGPLAGTDRTLPVFQQTHQAVHPVQ